MEISYTTSSTKVGKWKYLSKPLTITIKTLPLALTQEQRKGLTEHMDRVINGKDQCTSLILNEANLTQEERSRLIHWRQAHRQSGEGKIHENCPICEEGKRKTKGFNRNKRVQQNSMGEESYQGAKGGFVFVCPSSGIIKVKLYASSEQFPAILYQVLQDIEAEGYACREMYVNTFKVNFSSAAEVAAMFKLRIVPVSSGTLHENTYADSAVRTIAVMSRSLMAGAPHLDRSCWGVIRCLQCQHPRDLAPTRKQQHEPVQN
jgi:hypothetical protein